MKIVIVLIGLAVLGVAAYFLLGKSGAASTIKPNLSPLYKDPSAAYPDYIPYDGPPKSAYVQLTDTIKDPSTGAPKTLTDSSQVIKNYLTLRAAK